MYAIDAATGELTYTGSGEDPATNPSDTLTVRASDGVHSVDVSVTVTVVDVAEPPVFDAASYAFELAENADGSAVPVSLGQVAATDPDGDAVTYSIVGGNEAGLYAIDAATGELTYTGSGEDPATNPSDTLTVRASDGVHSVDVAVTIDIIADTIVAAPLNPWQTPGEDEHDGSDAAGGEWLAGNESTPPYGIDIDYSPAARFVSSVLAEVLGPDSVRPTGEQPAPDPVQSPGGDASRPDRHAPDTLAEGYTIVLDANAAVPADLGV